LAFFNPVILLSKAFVAAKYDFSPIFWLAKRTANLAFSSSYAFISFSIFEIILLSERIDSYGASRKEQLISHFSQ